MLSEQYTVKKCNELFIQILIFTAVFPHGNFFFFQKLSWLTDQTKVNVTQEGPSRICSSEMNND